MRTVGFTQMKDGTAADYRLLPDVAVLRLLCGVL